PAGNNQVEFATATPHGLKTNDSVTISGVTGADVNGTFTVTVSDPTHFKIITPSNIVTVGKGGAFAGPNRVTAVNGFAIFNQTYVNQTDNADKKYTLGATSTGLTAAPTSSQFIISAPFTIPGAPGLSVATPGSQTSGKTFPVTVQLLKDGQPAGTAYDDDHKSPANVKLELRDANGDVITDGSATLVVENSGARPDTEGKLVYKVTINLA